MRLSKIGATLAASLLLLAACGTDEVPTLEDADPVPTPPAAATVQTTDSELGTILATADGDTLYIFLNDEEGESTCYDQCAQTWPPLIEAAPTAGPGVEAMLATTERRDGSRQVTINERPLYTYTGDTEPGQTNGQGVGDRWYVVGPDGEAIQD